MIASYVNPAGGRLLDLPLDAATFAIGSTTFSIIIVIISSIMCLMCLINICTIK